MNFGQRAGLKSVGVGSIQEAAVNPASQLFNQLGGRTEHGTLRRIFIVHS